MAYGDGNRGKGKGMAFLKANLTYEGDDCLIWPLSRDDKGYGWISFEGKPNRAHRVMCILVNGKPPSPTHTAAHLCGKGHLGCVHPKHLAWKTPKENMADCHIHGTVVRHRYGPFGKLSFEKAEKIRSLKGVHTQLEIADMFGVSYATISDIWRWKIWARPHRLSGWTEDEDAVLRSLATSGMSFEDMAKRVKRPLGGVTRRFYKLGLSKPRLHPYRSGQTSTGDGNGHG